MKVRTSNGNIEEFNEEKIRTAILKDQEFLNKLTDKNINLTDNEIELILDNIADILDIYDEDIISSDTIRGFVTTELIKLGYIELSNISEIVGLRMTDLLNIWNGNAYADNANMNGKTPEAQHKFIADNISKKAILRIFPDNIRMAHLTGRIHVHDADFFATRPFCNEHDLRYYLYYGMYADGTGDNIPIAAPAQNAEVAILHAAKALGSAQQFFAGGQGHQNFLTFISPYLEDKSYKEIKQLMQMYIWEMSQMLSRGSQACFSTTQLTPGVPDVFKDVPIVYKGKIWDGNQSPLRMYGEFEREVRLAFKAYTEVMITGDIFGRPFSFPKYEIELLSEHFNENTWNETYEDAPSYKELWLDMCKLIAKDGTPYIHNSLGAKKSTITCYSCCAFEFTSSMHSDPNFDNKLYFKNGEHFILGSLQVVTLNLPQAAYESDKSIDKFVEYNRESIKLAIDVFKIKIDLMNKQSLSFQRQTPIDLNDKNKHAPPLWDINVIPCCIGVVGLNEAVKYISGYEIHENRDSWKLGVELLTRLQLVIAEEATGLDFKVAFARTPAETTAQRFAICDLFNENYANKAIDIVKGDVESAIDDYKISKDLPIYYTNGAMISNDANVSLFEKMRLEEFAFSIFDGGNIFHIFLGENIPNPEGIFNLINNIVHNTNIKYFAFTKDYTICKQCNNTMPGLQDNCKKCNSDDITQFSRITGYIQAVKGKRISGWNKGKREELLHRIKYEV